MKVFITGASGFIGSHITKTLLNSGHDVLALAMPNDNLSRIQDILPHIEVLVATLQDVQSIEKKLREWRPNSCVHLAWYAEPGKYLNSKENLNSLQNSLDLLEVLSACGCEQITCAGTCFEYDQKSSLLKENDKTKPLTLYASCKLSFQMIGEQLAVQSGMRFAWGRIFYLYGIQEDPRRLVPAAIIKLLKDEIFPTSPGEQVRDYLHVSDVANAFLFLTEKQVNGIYNICSAKPVTIKNILDTIGTLTGNLQMISYGSLPYREWEPMFICGENERLKSIGWSPKVNLQTGLQETIDWWKQSLNKQ
jgi:nucleoside-diphosphate-sugar epimerase